MDFEYFRKIYRNKKALYSFLIFPALWLMIWATYNTDIFRVFVPGFPRNILELIHGLRTFLPFFAMLFAVIFLIKKRNLPQHFFLTPLGLLGIYTIIGIISSVFSSSPVEALYWNVLYGSVIVVLLAVLLSSDPARKLSTIININWLICAILSILLIVFFLIQPKVISSLTSNFLICSDRPYEKLAGILREPDMLGVPGTRPTGLGRYAGVAAIVAFTYLLYCKRERKFLKFIWFLVFVIFFLIILFSKGKTEVVGFIAAIIAIICFGKKLSIRVIFGSSVIIFLLCFVILFNIPCANTIGIKNFFAPKTISIPVTTSSPETVSTFLTAPVSSTLKNSIPKFVPVVKEKITLKSISSFSTLTGRTTGVWPDSWKLFLSNPLLGYGFQADRFFLNGQHAHNILLQALVQTGLFGTIPLLLAFILIFVYLYRAIRTKSIEEKEKSFLMIITGVFIFFAIRAITESSGAYFDADWLLLAPIIVYAQYLNSNRNISLPEEKLPVFILGKKINPMELKEVLEKVYNWITYEPQKSHWIVFCGMQGIVEGYKNPKFQEIINSADISLPDGMSLLFFGKLAGFQIRHRIAGPDFMEEYFKFTKDKEFTNFFLGDTNDTLEKLVKKTLLNFPNLKIIGTYSPPFREFTAEDNQKIIEIINQKKPDVLWVSFNLIKQEEWIYKYRQEVQVPVIIGVGAAFKFLSGKVARAPRFVSNIGFEWLWRLFQEPKIIWKRVFLGGPLFLWIVLKDLFNINNKST